MGVPHRGRRGAGPVHRHGRRSNPTADWASFAAEGRLTAPTGPNSTGADRTVMRLRLTPPHEKHLLLTELGGISWDFHKSILFQHLLPIFRATRGRVVKGVWREKNNGALGADRTRDPAPIESNGKLGSPCRAGEVPRC